MRLVLVDTSTGTSHDIRESEAVIGRDPSAQIVISGDAAKTVSGRHARVFLADNGWWVEDVGSRNGTFIGSKRLEPGIRHAIVKSSIIGLGTTGPRLQVQELETRAIMATMLESVPPPPVRGHTPELGDMSRTVPLKRPTAPVARPDPAPPRPAPAPEPPRAAASADAAEASASAPHTTVIHVALHNNHSGQNYEADATVVTIGRAMEASVQIEGESAASVSRIHTEIYFYEGKIYVRDNGSRHGTFVNGKKVEIPHVIVHGDFIMLGPGGPTFTVDDAGVAENVNATAAVATPRIPGAAVPSSAKASPPKRKTPLPANAGPVTRLARQSGVVGRTLLFRNAIEEISQKSARKVRVAGYTTVGVLVVVIGGLVAYQRRQLASEHSRSQAQMDSIRATATAETNRLQHAFDSASKAAAPREVLDSLRNALDASGRRTAALEEALQRTKQSLDQELAIGDSVRKAAQAELVHAREEVSKASAAGATSGLVLDSLRHALKAAEDRAKEVNDEIRASSGVNWARVASMNEGAVGLVVSVFPRSAEEIKRARLKDPEDTNRYAHFNGTGFAVTPTGYMLTNRHVVKEDSISVAESLYVIMADQKSAYIADLVFVAPDNGPDVSVLKIRGFHGPVLAHIDWTSTKAVQGEGAALIGFPNGYYMALDTLTGAVRTSISSGIFAKVAPDEISFAGFSVHGSSGSPLFNAAGEVVAIHKAGLVEGPGLGFSVPLAQVVPILPASLRSEIGIH